MEAAAKAGKEFVVLDRPDPIGGEIIEGPLLDGGKESFVGIHNIPIRYGLTIGELAKMYAKERKLDVKLTVVPMRGLAARHVPVRHESDLDEHVAEHAIAAGGRAVPGHRHDGVHEHLGRPRHGYAV